MDLISAVQSKTPMQGLNDDQRQVIEQIFD